MIAKVSRAGALSRAGRRSGKSWRTHNPYSGREETCQPETVSTSWKARPATSYDRARSASAARISSSRGTATARSAASGSSRNSALAFNTLAISLAESALGELKRSASRTAGKVTMLGGDCEPESEGCPGGGAGGERWTWEVCRLTSAGGRHHRTTGRARNFTRSRAGTTVGSCRRGRPGRLKPPAAVHPSGSPFCGRVFAPPGFGPRRRTSGPSWERSALANRKR